MEEKADVDLLICFESRIRVANEMVVVRVDLRTASHDDEKIDSNVIELKDDILHNIYEITNENKDNE